MPGGHRATPTCTPGGNRGGPSDVQRHMRMFTAAVVVALTLTACGDAGTEPLAAPPPDVSTDPTTTSIPPSTTTAPPADGQLDDDWPAQPPAVVFESATGPIERPPFTVCWSQRPPDDPEEEYESWCADGAPDDPSPLVVPVNGQIPFSFPIDGWRFDAHLEAPASEVRVEAVDDQRWVIMVPDQVSNEMLIVSGFGPQGDVHVSIQLPVASDDATPGGDAEPVTVRDHCGFGLGVIIGDDWFVLDGPLAGVAPDAGYPWERSDFPDDWDVEILNEQPVDGDGFVLTGVEAIRVDDATLDVRTTETQEPIGRFVLDTTPMNERLLCG